MKTRGNPKLLPGGKVSVTLKAGKSAYSDSDEGANAQLDSDSEEMDQIHRQPNPLNTNLTEQAVVSIITEDDAYPLSHNGDGDDMRYAQPVTYYGQGQAQKQVP